MVTVNEQYCYILQFFDDVPVKEFETHLFMYFQLQIMGNLQSIENFFKNKIKELEENQSLMGKDIDDLFDNYQATTQKLEALEKQVAELAIGNQEIPYRFMLPDRTEWFSGRESELENLQNLLHTVEDNKESTNNVKIASVCGLGGAGKTSLAAEYAHRREDYYSGGVFWFSGEDETKFANSVNKHAVYFGTLLEASPSTTLIKTLEVISKINKPWLIVLDEMDEYKLCSNIGMLLCGPWKRTVKGSGHIIVTTRRKPKVMVETVRKFEESQCLHLDCFSENDGIQFVFKRIGLTCDQNASDEAASLVEILGGLPLALEQACAYISQLSCSLSSYLEQYKKCSSSLELLDQQDASSASLYESPERLAVRTTWLLNFEYIKRSKNGNFAVRFLHACAFFNPTDIQPELINSGKPPIEDEAYRDYVETPLGSSHILKLLTDFSLFRKNKGSSLVVHRLVQEVIRDKLEPDVKVLSLVDAIRMLSFAFSRCASPDDTLTSDINLQNDRVSTLANNPYVFFPWKKFCVHAQKVLEILGSFNQLDKRVLLPETAKILYECAVYFNISNKTAEAMRSLDFAKKIIDLGRICLKKDELAEMFPHEIPMPESLRRYIFYSSMTPLIAHNSTTSLKNEKIGSTSKMKQLHTEGNRYFKNGNYCKAIEMYSSAMAEINSFDPKLLCDRALAYINLKQYKSALNDSENYLLKEPKCWLGISMKAFAMHGLNEIWEACSFAALAFYHNRNIFSEFQQFADMFFSLEKRIYICNSHSVLTDIMLKPVSHSPAPPRIPGRIIVIEPGDYYVDIGSHSKMRVGIWKPGLFVENCILLGVENSKTSVVVRFINELMCLFPRYVLAKNISFVFSEKYWESLQDSITTWVNCSFTSELEESEYTFLSCGTDTFTYCSFENSKSPGMTVCGRTCVESCVFSGGEYSGVNVSTGANLLIKDSKLYGNLFGFYIHNLPLSCSIQNCDIFDNKWQGICVTETSLNVRVENCRIYQNDRDGIRIDERSSATVLNCEIFDNRWHGIVTLCNGRCDAFGNTICDNKSGGVLVVPVDITKVKSPSTIKINTIYDNHGFGIRSDMMVEDTPLDTSVLMSPKGWEQKIYYDNNKQQFMDPICKDNYCHNNQSALSSSASVEKNGNDAFCSYCRKKCTSNCGQCFVTKYCNKKCQRDDWSQHKKECQSILESSTVTITLLPKKELMNMEHTWFLPNLSPEIPGLAPKGPKYAPKYGQRFLVKILAADEEWHSNLEGPKFTICDRSRTVDGCLDKHCYPRLFKIVTQCGISSHLVEGWIKKFFWAKAVDAGNYRKLRVFVTNFPANEDW